MKKLLANIVDQIIVFGLGALLLLLTTLIMNLIGFKFNNDAIPAIKQYAYIVCTAIIAILYYPIVESTSLNTTIGKKLLGIQ